MRFVRTWAVALVALLGAAGWVTAADDPPSYTNEVKPFLTKYCMDCHSGARPKAGYSVETLERLTKMGRKGALIVSEKPDDSLVIRTLAGKGKQMPPKNKPQPKADEVAKVREWIKAGAKDDTPADDKKKPSDAKP
jgi:hypothetical protein